MYTKVSAVVRRFVVPAALALGVTGFTSIASADPFGPGGSRAMSSKETPKGGSADHSHFTAAAHAMVGHVASQSQRSSNVASSSRGVTHAGLARR